MKTIEEIRNGKEGQTFDLKSIQIDPKALAIPIVAMANADGGMLAIGISDKTRKIEGVNQYTERLNELLRVPFDFCNPSIPVACRYMDCMDNSSHVVTIQNLSYKRWWLMPVATEPTISKEQRYRSRCSMTDWCLNRPASCQDR